MLAQAEHDSLASAILVTESSELTDCVKYELILQVEKLETKEIIKKSFAKYSCIVIVDNIKEAIEFTNDFAPEHLEIIGYGKTILKQINNAGSVFFGKYSVEAAGDYCSGPNHILPTGQFARTRAGLSVYDFLKMPTIQILTRERLKFLKTTIQLLAGLENLPAHANASPSWLCMAWPRRRNTGAQSVTGVSGSFSISMSCACPPDGE